MIPIVRVNLRRAIGDRRLLFVATLFPVVFILVTGLLARVRRELADAAGVEAASVVTVLTGGLARTSWVAGIEGVSRVDPDLTLKGLAILHAEVTGGEAIEAGLG